MSDRISVVIATYNGERFLKKQLESVWNQRLKADEVIISDDNSSDSTIQIVKSFISTHNISNWTIVENSPDKRGVTNNYLNGLSKCSGDIVFLCDQDDIWSQNKISRCVNKFTKNDDVTCIVTAIEYIDGNDKPKRINTKYTNRHTHYISLKELLSVCSYLGMSAVFRRSVVVNASNELMNSSSHDWALFIEAYNQGKILYIGDVLASYRHHSDNTSIIKEYNRQTKRVKLLERQIKHIEGALISGGLTSADKSICEDYLIFLKLRIDAIKRRKIGIILKNIYNYIHLKYSMRSIAADIYSCV